MNILAKLVFIFLSYRFFLQQSYLANSLFCLETPHYKTEFIQWGCYFEKTLLIEENCKNVKTINCSLLGHMHSHRIKRYTFLGHCPFKQQWIIIQRMRTRYCFTSDFFIQGNFKYCTAYMTWRRSGIYVEPERMFSIWEIIQTL